MFISSEEDKVRDNAMMDNLKEALEQAQQENEDKQREIQQLEKERQLVRCREETRRSCGD